jgi:hypothetical protein
LPTPAVSGDIAFCTAHALHNAPNTSSRNKSNCRIQDLSSAWESGKDRDGRRSVHATSWGWQEVWNAPDGTG